MSTPEELAAAKAASDKAAADAATKAAEDAAAKKAADDASAAAATAAKAEADKKAADEAAAKGLDGLKLGEGSLLKAERLDAIKALAKEKNLSVEQATLLLNNEDAALKNYTAAQKAEYDSTVNSWTEASKKDPRFGGEKLAANLEAGKRLLTKYGSEKFRALLKDTGYENHPEVIDFFVNVARAAKEDNFFSSEAPAKGTPKTRAEALYGKKKAA